MLFSTSQDYSDGILLDANENSIGPSVSGREHLQLNRLRKVRLLVVKIILMRF